MGMIQEFKEFALKGNMIDMAIGIVVGGAFGKVVSSLVGDIITPIIGSLTSGTDFTGMTYPLKEATDPNDNLLLKYGSFLQSIFDFIVVAFALFMVVKVMNAARKRFEKAQAAAPAAPPEDVRLLREIRDALQRR
jgi:large conductance mechanosensitive channel